MDIINRSHFAQLTVYTLFMGFLLTAKAADKSLVAFSDESAAQNWTSVNDNVMGGISEGGFRMTDDDTLEFSGRLSLENNGGFASIRTKPKNLNIDGYDAISLRLKGDGRTYYFNLMTSSRNSASSYRAPIETQKDTWQNVQISLKDFVYTSFGRVIGTVAPVKAKDIQSVGFTLSDKKPGPFQLEVKEIRALKATGSTVTTVTGDPDKSGSRDIVDTAIEAGAFKTLVSAVKAAGLVDSLKANGPLTVFAPTDEAFAKLPEGTIEDLLRPENRDKLIAVLTYHVVPDKILLSKQSWKTLQGQSIEVKSPGSVKKINQARVLKSDILASNGVIHVIDSVLLTPIKTLTAKQAAKEVIQLAINRGVPLFNAGQPSACAAIYEVAANSLLKSHTNALDKESRLILEDALNDIRKDDDPSQKAWKLRRALDAVNESLHES